MTGGERHVLTVLAQLPAGSYGSRRNRGLSIASSTGWRCVDRGWAVCHLTHGGFCFEITDAGRAAIAAEATPGA